MWQFTLARAAVRRQKSPFASRSVRASRLYVSADRERSLGLLGGVFGFLFGYGGCRLLSSCRPPNMLKTSLDLRIPSRLGFAFAMRY